MSDDKELTVEERLASELGYKPSGEFSILEAKDYDAVVHGIIHLGRQNREPFQGKPRKPANMIRVVFELPGELRSNDGLPVVIAKKIPLSDSVEKGNFAKFLVALGEKPTSTNILQYMLKEGLAKLLGKSAVVTVGHFEGDKGETAYVDEITKLDPRLPQPKPVRETFLFHPRQPDMRIFKDILTFWCKQDIMSAVDSDQFPKELHGAWVAAQEAEANKENSSNSNAEQNSTESIE